MTNNTNLSTDGSFKGLRGYGIHKGSKRVRRKYYACLQVILKSYTKRKYK